MSLLLMEKKGSWPYEEINGCFAVRFLYIFLSQRNNIRVLVVCTTTGIIASLVFSMEEDSSEPVEMYLETVYRLKETQGIARTSAIAEFLGVSMGAVTNTLASLESRGLVRRQAYRGVDLTPKGEALALRVLRKHRLVERLLTEVLGMEWSEVHETACRLEHAITDDVTEALERLLKNPKTCPHGNPIPNSAGKIRQTSTEPLSKLSPTQKGTLVSIREEKSDVLRYLASLGLVPGVSIRVEDRAPFNGPIIVNVRGSRYALGQQVASSIRVRRT
jgi:DtxR family Mn-dependent transcriptional regulator